MRFSSLFLTKYSILEAKFTAYNGGLTPSFTPITLNNKINKGMERQNQIDNNIYTTKEGNK